jgi:hypothetical protein
LSESDPAVATSPYAPQGYNSGDSDRAPGLAFVFAKHGSTWVADPIELSASNGRADDSFGWYGLTTIGRRFAVVGTPYSPDGGLSFDGR